MWTKEVEKWREKVELGEPCLSTRDRGNKCDLWYNATNAYNGSQQGAWSVN